MVLYSFGVVIALVCFEFDVGVGVLRFAVFWVLLVCWLIVLGILVVVMFWWVVIGVL